MADPLLLAKLRISLRSALIKALKEEVNDL